MDIVEFLKRKGVDPLVAEAMPRLLDEYKAADIYEEARNLVISRQQCSISFVQRRLGVGYLRAGEIVKELENNGVVGPAKEGCYFRDVLISAI